MLVYFLAWFPMLLLAVLNGIFREAVLKKWLSDLPAHQVSTFTLIALFAFYIYLVTRRFPPASPTQAIFIGILWVILTLVFEFGFGRFRGNSWEELLEDYNLFKGHLWVLIPLWVLIAPYLFYHLAKV
jgi:hypothetical protein